MERNNKVAVILLNLNQEHHTRACINSLLEVSFPHLDIVLIDNGSLDGSGERLARDFPTIRFVRNARNVGFAEGNNIGIRLALENGADYVMLLNNDTIVHRDFIQPLLELAEADERIGVQSGKVYFHSDPKKFWYAGGLFNIEKALAKHRGMFEHDAGQFDRAEESDFSTGCLMFFSRRALHEVGLLDPSYFIYFEDVDWCLRARRIGWRVMFNPGCVIWHKVSATTTIDSPFYLYLTMRNKILMIRRHSTLFKTILSLPYLFYFYSRQILRLALRWRSWRGVKAVLFGLVDGIRNYTEDGGKGRLEVVVGKRL
jgi:GT2 family glycosyltransferase